LRHRKRRRREIEMMRTPDSGASAAVRQHAGDGEDSAIAAVRARLAGRADVRVALVFGSRATGQARPTSDVDVAVRAHGVDLLTLAAELSRAAGLDVDVVSLDDAGVPLLARILRDGIVVHEAVPGAAATWRSHALADLETDRPWFARMRDTWLEHVATRAI
jgi:predicted nucleotidyltransferase